MLALHPAAVVLLIGTNDIDIGANPADVADNLKAILTALKNSNAKLPVIVCRVMPSAASLRRPAAKIQQLNALVDEWVARDPQFIRCDTYTIFADEQGEASSRVSGPAAPQRRRLCQVGGGAKPAAGTVATANRRPMTARERAFAPSPSGVESDYESDASTDNDHV